MTEASTKKRASLHLVRGEAALRQFDRGRGGARRDAGGVRERRCGYENHTLKRALTHPRLFSGIETPSRTRYCTAPNSHPASSRRNFQPTRPSGCFRPRATCSRSGSRGAPRPRRQVPGAGDGIPAGDGRPRQVRPRLPLSAARPSSGSSTPTTSSTTAPRARPAAAFSPTGACPACSKATGRARLRSWRRAGRRASGSRDRQGVEKTLRANSGHGMLKTPGRKRQPSFGRAILPAEMAFRPEDGCSRRRVF